MDKNWRFNPWLIPDTEIVHKLRSQFRDDVTLFFSGSVDLWFGVPRSMGVLYIRTLTIKYSRGTQLL